MTFIKLNYTLQKRSDKRHTAFVALDPDQNTKLLTNPYIKACIL